MKGPTIKNFVVALATMASCFFGQGHALAADTDILVDLAFVKDKVSKPGWVLVDMRSAGDYAKGHIPGAVGVPSWVSKIYADDTKRSATIVPRLEKTLGEMGISGDSHVIFYGNPKNLYLNTYMFWVLEAFGCNSKFLKCTAHYFDGGLDAWKSDGGEIELVAANVTPAKFKAVAGTKRGVKADELTRVVEGKQKALILDARTPDEFAGLDVRSLRGGHVPKAINVDYNKNFDPTTNRMLPLSQLQTLYVDVPKNGRVITYCQTGGRAAYAYLVLRALGYKDVAIYHDGWRVYGSDLNLEVEDETWYDFTKVSSTIKAVSQMQEKIK